MRKWTQWFGALDHDLQNIETVIRPPQGYSWQHEDMHRPTLTTLAAVAALTVCSLEQSASDARAKRAAVLTALAKAVEKS